MENSDGHPVPAFAIYADYLPARVVAAEYFLVVGIDDALHAPETVRAVLHRGGISRAVAVV